MPLRSLAKRLIAGLTMVSLIFQAALLAAQFSVLIASGADAAAASPAGIICTDHGIADLSADQPPADRPTACGFCPWCSMPGAGQLAVLSPASFSLLDRRATDVIFYVSADRRAFERSAQPRSRGPPAVA